MGQRNADRGRDAQRRSDARHDRRPAGRRRAGRRPPRRRARRRTDRRPSGAPPSGRRARGAPARPRCRPAPNVRGLCACRPAPARHRGGRGPGWRAAPGRRAGWRRPPAGAARPASVRRSGSPGPAPTMWAMPTGAIWRRAASSSPSAVRRAPASSPDSARRAAGPSTRRRKKARRRAGSAIRAFTCARKVVASRARAPMRSGNAASMRPRRTVASVGEAPPVEIATTTPSRSTMAGRMKSHSAGRSATFTGTPADLATFWAAASRSASPVAMKAAAAPRKSALETVGETTRCTSAPAERTRSARRSGGRPLAHHHDPAAGQIEEQRQMLHETATRSSRLKTSMAAAWEIDRTHRTASGLRRILDMRNPLWSDFLIWRVFAHPPWLELPKVFRGRAFPAAKGRRQEIFLCPDFSPP